MLFGEVRDRKLYLNAAGVAVAETIDTLPDNISGVQVDESIVMPNHVHLIVCILHGTQEYHGDHHFCVSGSEKPVVSLSEIVRRFKSVSARTYSKGVKHHNWTRFDRRLWQRNYYEHIIRNERDLNAIRDYIIYNPVNWRDDPCR